jgi:protein SCO1/2
MFGVHAYGNEGQLDHSLHTVLIDRKQKLAANIEGNQFTATQLGDLVQTLLR